MFPFIAAVNVARARAQGIEFIGAVDILSNLVATVSYTYTESEDLDTGRMLVREPRHRWHVGLTWEPLPRLSLWVEVHTSSRQFDSEEVGYNRGHTRVDTGGTFRLLDKHGWLQSLELTARIQNALDEDYAEVRGFPALGIQALAGLRARFSVMPGRGVVPLLCSAGLHAALGAWLVAVPGAGGLRPLVVDLTVPEPPLVAPPAPPRAPARERAGERERAAARASRSVAPAPRAAPEARPRAEPHTAPPPAVEARPEPEPVPSPPSSRRPPSHRRRRSRGAAAGLRALGHAGAGEPARAPADALRRTPSGAGQGAGAPSTPSSGTGAGTGPPVALATPSPGPGDARGGGSGEYGRYLARFRSAVQAELRYPLSARRRGLAGSVELEVVDRPRRPRDRRHVWCRRPRTTSSTRRPRARSAGSARCRSPRTCRRARSSSACPSSSTSVDGAAARRRARPGAGRAAQPLPSGGVDRPRAVPGGAPARGPGPPDGGRLRRAWALVLAGGVAVATVTAIAAGAAAVVGLAVDSAGPAGVLLEAVALKCAFSLRALRAAALAVRDALIAGELAGARRALGLHLVSRPTGELDAADVASGAVESVAENLTDSWIAPLSLLRCSAACPRRGRIAPSTPPTP